MNNEINKNELDVNDSVIGKNKGKKWPDKFGLVRFSSIVDPLRDALQTAMEKEDKVYEEGIEWNGLELGGRESATVFQPEAALHAQNLKHSKDSQDRDVFTEILSIAVRLGVEQGRREIRGKLYQLKFMFTSESGKAMIETLLKYGDV